MNTRTVMEIPAAAFLPPEQRTLSRRLGETALKRGEVTSFNLMPGALIQLEARTGAGWVTMEGDPRDYPLIPPEVLCFTGPGRVVVEAINREGLFFVSGIARFEG